MRLWTDQYAMRKVNREKSYYRKTNWDSESSENFFKRKFVPP